MATKKRSSADGVTPPKKPTRAPSNPSDRGLHQVWIRREVHTRLALTQKLLAIELRQRQPDATPLTMGQIAEEAIAMHLATLIEKHGQAFALLSATTLSPPKK